LENYVTLNMAGVAIHRNIRLDY